MMTPTKKRRTFCDRFRRRLDRARWCVRMVRLGRMTPAQARAQLPYIMEALEILPKCRGDRRRKAALFREAVLEFNEILTQTTDLPYEKNPSRRPGALR